MDSRFVKMLRRLRVRHWLMIAAIMLAVGLGICYAQKHYQKALFLERIDGELDSILAEIDHAVYCTTQEELQTSVYRLLSEITDFEAEMECGNAYVSQSIPITSPDHGFGRVGAALLGTLGSEYADAPVWLNGLSEGEKQFLQELSKSVATLQDSIASEQGLLPGNRISKYVDVYGAFEDQWQVEGIRVRTGESPFDSLKPPQKNRQ